MTTSSLVMVARIADTPKNGKEKYELWSIDGELPADPEDDEREFRAVQEATPEGLFKPNPQYLIASIDYAFFRKLTKEMHARLIQQFDSIEECLASMKLLTDDQISAGQELHLFETVDM